MGNFVGDYALDGVRVRRSTVEEARVLFPGYWDVLLTEWAERDKIMTTSDGSLLVSDVEGLRRAQDTLAEEANAWEELMEILEDNCYQAESYNVATAVSLLAAGWRPTSE
jgi:hypothetical protein